MVSTAQQQAVLASVYLGPADYYSWLVNRPTIIDPFVFYDRQTFANRCSIVTSGGVQNLSVPIEKPQPHTPMKKVKIAYTTDWQALHYKAIESAYNSSPYFSYFKDELLTIYQTKYDTLFEWNNTLQRKILQWLGYDNLNVYYADHFVDCAENKNCGKIDLRTCIHPKKKCVPLHARCMNPYYQVFQQRFGFVPRLSVLDMVFNIGREARILLNENKQ
ncbi:MAG: WbqC family protein [Bacteroidales bacterium]|nr:WbqC family protein [Bacteroidales bacterium]